VTSKEQIPQICGKLSRKYSLSSSVEKLLCDKLLRVAKQIENSDLDSFAFIIIFFFFFFYLGI
jgi:hypothetical protein